MTKAEVANCLSERTGLSHKEAVKAVEVFLDAIRNGLTRGEKVSLVGFGTFYIKERDARDGRNPRTGEVIRIPAKRVASFKPGKAFREVVNDAPEAAEEPAIL